MKYCFMAYGFTHDGGGFPAHDGMLSTLAEAVEVLNKCWTSGNGWVEVSLAGNRLAMAHLVYKNGMLSKVHKFKKWKEL